MNDETDPPVEEAGLGASIKRILDLPGEVVRDAAGAVLNTSRFLASRQYRHEGAFQVCRSGDIKLAV